MLTPQQLTQKAAGKKKENKAFFKQLAGQPKGQVDELFHEHHASVFAQTNCLNCANCCLTTGPMIIDKDVQRIAKFLKMRPGDFMQQYLITDNEGHYIFEQSPCPMLGDDNYCRIYEVRPKACREYPHTDRRNMKGILTLTLKNIEICPAVYEIVERMKEE